MTKHIVYKYTSPSGKVYVGQTCRESLRKLQHRNCAERGVNTAFYRAVRKYGFSALTYEVIVADVPDYMIDAFERYWINYYNSCHGKGYNSDDGGSRGRPNQATRDRIRSTLKGTVQSIETKSKRNAKLKGLKRTKEQKDRYRKCQEHAYKRVLCVETGITYGSVAEAQRALGVLRSHIGAVCVGKRKSTLGYTWKWDNKVIKE